MTASPAAKVAQIVQAAPLLLRVQQAAEVLGLSVRSFERLCAAGRLPRPVRLGRLRLWRYRDLQRFVESSCRLEANA